MFASWDRSKLIKWVLAVGVLLLSTSVLAYFVYRERDVLLTYDWSLDWRYIAAAFCTMMLALVLPSYVWTNLMQTLGNELPAVAHVRAYFITHVARRLPGTIWYLLGRNYIYKQHGESMRLVTVASGVEFVIGVSSGAFVSLLFARYIWTEFSRLSLLFLIAALALGVVTTHPRTIGWGMAKMQLVMMPQIRYRSIIKWFLIYAVLWVFGGVILFFTANALTDIDVSHLPYVIASWCLVGTMSYLVFFLPTNLGITEVGLSFLLAAIMPSSMAVLVAVFFRLLLIAFEIIAVLAVMAATNGRSSRTPASPE